MTRFWLNPYIASTKKLGIEIRVEKTPWPGIICLRRANATAMAGHLAFHVRGNARDRRRLRRAIQRYFNEGKR